MTTTPNNPKRRRHDGVRTLEDIRLRCVIDDIRGCWIWGAAVDNGSPRVWLPDAAGPLRAGTTTTAARAAWVLSGRPLQPNHLVIRTCTEGRCCRPDHGIAGTRVQLGQVLHTSGHLRGRPERGAVNSRNRARMMVPREVIQRGEAMFAAGAMAKDVRAALGVCARTAQLIRDGLHPRSTGAAPTLVRGASVFALGAPR